MLVNVALPPKVRAILYYVVFVLGLFIVVATAIFGALGGTWPVWFKAVAAASAAFASALGLTASSNLPTGDIVKVTSTNNPAVADTFED